MKKIYIITFLLFTTLMFVGCSSDPKEIDSSSNSNSNPDLKVKFTLDGLNDYEGEFDILNSWRSTLQKDGTTEHSLLARVDRKGIDTDEKAHVTVVFSFSFIATEPLKAGQVYTKITDVYANFTLNNNNPNTLTGVCGYLQAELDNKTIAQIKITSVSGNRVSGEFYITNIHNSYYNPYTSTKNWYESQGCADTSIPKYVNISKGEFYNVEIRN